MLGSMFIFFLSKVGEFRQWPKMWPGHGDGRAFLSSARAGWWGGGASLQTLKN